MFLWRGRVAVFKKNWRQDEKSTVQSGLVLSLIVQNQDSKIAKKFGAKPWMRAKQNSGSII